jgi:hypothetical protein
VVLCFTNNNHTNPLSMFISSTIQFVVAVPAGYVNGLAMAAAEEVLDTKLLKYDERLRGVLLAYQDLDFAQDFGSFQDEQPDVLFKFQAKIVLFAPKVGQKIKAVVSDIQAGHLTLLAAGVFTVVVPQSDFPKHCILEPTAIKTGGKRSLMNSKSQTIEVTEGETYYVKCVRVSHESGNIHVEASFLN